jgi:hypothetical protein
LTSSKTDNIKHKQGILKLFRVLTSGFCTVLSIKTTKKYEESILIPKFALQNYGFSILSEEEGC